MSIFVNHFLSNFITTILSWRAIGSSTPIDCLRLLSVVRVRFNICVRFNIRVRFNENYLQWILPLGSTIAFTDPVRVKGGPMVI
jgi:hypothetical protein